MEVRSPGGFVFGIQGWEYGEVRPKAVTFFMDGTAKVSDHHGNAIPDLANIGGMSIQFISTAGVFGLIPLLNIVFMAFLNITHMEI